MDRNILGGFLIFAGWLYRTFIPLNEASHNKRLKLKTIQSCFQLLDKGVSG